MVAATGAKVAVPAVMPLSDIELICSPVSDAPAASITRMCGSASRIRSRTPGVSGAPPLLNAASPDRS